MSEQALANLQTSGNMRWYVIHAYSGMEKSVQKGLAERIARSGMADKFGKILVPSEEVVEIKSGHKAVSERRFFPGYVLIEMEMTDETWHLVKNTPRCVQFGLCQLPCGASCPKSDRKKSAAFWTAFRNRSKAKGFIR